MRSTALTNRLFPVARIKIQGEKRGGHTAMQITRLRRLLLFALAAGTLFWSAPLPAEGTGTQVVFRSGTTIDAPGNYLLLNDISTGGPGPALTITSGGVTLDLNGHQITGPGGNRETGIMIDGASGVKVFNGYVAYLGFAVVVNNSSNVVLRDLHIRGQGVAITAPPPEVGIMILQSKNVCVEKNVIYNDLVAWIIPKNVLSLVFQRWG